MKGKELVLMGNNLPLGVRGCEGAEELAIAFGQSYNQITFLEEKASKHQWKKKDNRREAQKSLSAMKKACQLGIEKQIEHHLNRVIQCFFLDTLWALGIQPEFLNNYNIERGGAEYRDLRTIFRETFFYYPINSDVPLPEEGLQFILDIAQDPIIPPFVEQIGIMERKKERFEILPDPELIMKVGDQWFKIMDWKDVNFYEKDQKED